MARKSSTKKKTPVKRRPRASTAAEPAQEKSAQPRKTSTAELKKTLAAHRRWVESEGREGKQANLQGAALGGANLQKTDFRGANLQKTDLGGANLQGAALWKANLQEAYLEQANLQGADLWGANLHGAALMKANLEGTNLVAANLQEAHFDGAVLNKARLSKADLKGAKLFRAQLEEADLSEADLQDIDGGRANLQKAYMAGAKLRGANLGRANLEGAVLVGVHGLNEVRNLQDANLKGVTGLLGTEFARKDITGTRLPDDIHEFKALQVVEETSKNARKIFLSMLLACVYSWWTIATTTGLNLLTNSATSPLPIIGTEIPIAWFYWAAPIILITLFVYLHFYLQHLWALLAQLPAIFPDGKRLDQRAYPWLLTGIVRRHFDLLKKDRSLPDKKDENSLDGEPETWKPRPAITHLKEWVTILLAWWVVPVTLLAFALRYLPRHEVWGTAFHVALLVASIWGAISFYGIAAITLRGEPSRLHRHWVMRLKAWLSAYMAHFRSSNIERADE